MWRLAGRKARVGTLIKGQMNIVHVHDEVCVLSDVALHSLSKGKGWPVTFITVFRFKDNKEGALPLRRCPLLRLRKLLLLLMLLLLLLFGCGCCCCCCLYLVVGCGGGSVGGCGFGWWVLCDVPLRRCVVLCRRLCRWCCRRCVLWCCAALSWWSEVVWLIPLTSETSAPQKSFQVWFLFDYFLEGQCMCNARKFEAITGL